jgi:hypothetical protein
MSLSRIIIIGAGPAGLCAAISAGRVLSGKQAEILILEGNTEAGKKLLLSGSGQCNFTNNLATDAFLAKCEEFGNYLKPAFYSLNNTALIELINAAGCKHLVREDGKVFPAGMKASEVRDALLKLVRQAGAELNYEARVASVEKIASGGFELKMHSGQPLGCDKLIIATGGAGYPQTGSDGQGLKLANSLGHKTIPFRTALGNVELVGFGEYASCAGVSLKQMELSFISGKQKHVAIGDLLFTHSGFSGPVILDNCHRVCAGDEISVCLLPNADVLIGELKKRGRGITTLNALQATGVPRSLLTIMLKRLSISTSALESHNKAALSPLLKTLKSFRFTIAKIQDISTAMASAGGIPLADINAKTMQSRLCPGLFFAGEIMDYSLPTGGFNIQMACSTGWLAGASAAKTL